MDFKKISGQGKNFWVRDSAEELNLLTKYDRIELAVFVISLVICAAISVYLWLRTDTELYYVLMMLAAPFFILGLMFYLRSKAAILLLIIVAGSILLFVFNILDLVTLFFIDFILIGSVGVVSVVVGIQKMIFYRVMSITEYMNIKDKMSIHEKIIAFFFNIPRDLDTRYITMDYNLNRASIPWREIWETMKMGLMIGIFLWIYLSMNPTIFSLDSFIDAPMCIFTIVLFIPVLVMPWTVFMALNVRIETKYRDFKLYDGIKETLKRMALPMFAAFIYVILAVNRNGFVETFGFIALSVVINIIIIGLTAVIYYAFFEKKLISLIVSKWKVFRPVELTDEVKVKREKPLPGTPMRDTKDFSKFNFRD